VPGLGTSFGRGGATTFAADLVNSDAVLIMGSNMAECHPVAFRWVVQAKTRADRPCVVIHVDPRFTRTSALADIYAPLRAGADIVFLGAIIRYVIENEKYFKEYVVNYTNAPTLISPDFKDTDELDGVFSGFDASGKRYDASTWQYQRVEGRGLSVEGQKDPTLQHPQCVFQILKRHFARYTPEMVEEVCGTPKATFLRVAEALTENSGPDRTSAICYAVGWTQHTTGVQMIRAAAILQLLLGNIGRPGGGILALRGHATIQGSTDIATLYNLLPGYLNAPNALKKHDSLKDYIATETTTTGYWANFPKFIVSLLKAWFGDDARPDNDFAFDYLPKTVGDHSHLPMFVAMAEGKIKGLFAMGQNPAVGGQNASLQRKALANLDWLVVRDLYETETASFWKDSPEVARGELRPEDIKTEVFLLPAAAAAEMDGSFTNTQRLVQWHDKAAEPPGDARSDIWFTVHLGRLVKDLYADSHEPRDRPIRSLVWSYVQVGRVEGVEGARVTAKSGSAASPSSTTSTFSNEPPAETILREINGFTVADGRPVAGFQELKDDGSTACGGWVYSGVFAPDVEHPLGENRAANRQGDDWLSLGWAWSWPANRRILYNRAAADPDGRPWPKEARLAHEKTGGKFAGYVYWQQEDQAVGSRQSAVVSGPQRSTLNAQPSPGRWIGVDVPDFPVTKPPDAASKAGATGMDAHDGRSPFVMKSGGKGWLFAPTGLIDGPLPTHYEPYESPIENVVYRQQSNPVTKVWTVAGNEYAPVGSVEFPCVLSTYRLTEHHLSGTMSRWLPWLAELQPELFVELSPEHAAEIGIANTDWVRITTPRGSIRAKALVTRRIRPFAIRGKTIHHVGLPWHWGYKGISTGDVVNDLSALVGEPNVTIHEAKVFVCRVDRVPKDLIPRSNGVRREA
jgi:formate dehydrogenase major subunit